MRTIENVNALFDYTKENPLNFSWLNPNTETKESTIPNSGNGRFAINKIERGEVIVLLGGLILTEDEYQQVRKRFPFISGLLVHEDFKLHQCNFFSENNGSLNHGCDPNCALYGQIMIKTTRDIDVGEELFVDYGTITNEDLVMFDNCECGAYNCRKYITAKDWLSSSFRLFHGRNFSYHLLELMRDTDPGIILSELLDLKKIDISKSSILSEELRNYE